MTIGVENAGGSFNFEAPAEVFACRGRRGHNPARYRRFDTTAEAVRFAIEELPAPLLPGTYLEAQEVRFDQEGIRVLYERADYPLPRLMESQAEDSVKR
jgi:hypothetical protein